ncbi:hypothetical protein Y032_0228g2855 [Ancylostoma ceylanicum]|uniref:Uncharacterized protein n=1 Tax=Ancylostoma ceylanicum TaxID=53326 RepID=A0A016SGI1_9BILA|nr:hypothetical protein Y032_0228g2855 [Ancylostoma ceylanicum]
MSAIRCWLMAGTLQIRLPLYSRRSTAASVTAPRRFWRLCASIVSGASQSVLTSTLTIGDQRSHRCRREM